MKVVIFAGGVGTRLWPLSRKNTPKQFEKIIGEKSTLQLAVDRVLPIVEPHDIYISSGKRYEDVIVEQLPMIPRENIILEPEMRDVGAAVGLVTALLHKISPEEPFIILWSDHMVKNEDLFRDGLKTVENVLKNNGNKIVFIGQDSRFGSQNLGWIEHGNQVDRIGDFEVFEFKSFHYRPTLERADEFHKSTFHSWNPGYFGTTPQFLYEQYQKFAPEMTSQLDKIVEAWRSEEFSQKLDEIYPTLEKISFDNLILEKIDPSDGFVIRADLGWSDIGAWEALKEALSSRDDENVTRGNVMLEESKDNLVFNYTDQMIVGIDLDKFLVINTNDVLLVCPKDSVPKVKKFVENMAGTENESLT